ncbi:MAG: tRNA pseudouridine(55) synthase TruB [Desulfobacterales bacterium]|nr:tRNA pseudouridine(55) synthase TruB [Desulfobacterales bacterium]
MMDGGQLNGIIVIDKPQKITSAGVVKFVKKTLKVDKVGHAGTLDPFAEGVLICCVNQACRLAKFLLGGNKKYVAELKLGEETDTQDLTGNVVATGEPGNLANKTIQTVCKSFEGQIEQLPPVFSALKHRGVPLYKLARRGRPVQKPPRRVKIDKIAILDIALPFIRFEVSCSAGTYIRTLAADVGRALGCGAHLHALKRIESSGFTLDQAISLSALQTLTESRRMEEHMISMADALPDLPAYAAGETLFEKIRHGKMIATRDLMSHNDVDISGIPDAFIKIVDQGGHLIAILNHHKFRQKLDYCCVFPNQFEYTQG